MTKKNEITTEQKETDIEILSKDGEVIENELVIKFKNPVQFEGKAYESIDLSGMHGLTGADMIVAERAALLKGFSIMNNEMTWEYAQVIAARATNLPVEFFQNLPIKEITRIKNRVVGFIYDTI